MARVLALVWGTYCCLRAIHPAHVRDQLWRRKLLITHLEGCTRQSCPALTYLSQGLVLPIFTMAPPQYFPGCFSLAFLEGHYPFSFPAATSLNLDPTIWDPSTSSNRVASFSSTLSWSHWRYSIVLLFLFSSSATLCLSAFSQVFSSTSLLAFWATCSARHNFATSSSWTRSCYSSSCLCYISCHCFSRILALFCEMSEWMGEDMAIWK